jgi:hypothetical protein
MAEEKKEEVKKPDEDWMTKKWRPLMAMMYMACCLCDFALFPIMFTVVQFWETQAANDAFRQWVPITLQGGGLFHVAMGGVLGVTAYGRTQEKLGGVATPPAAPAGLPAQTIAPTPAPTPIAATPAPVAVASAPVVVAQAPAAPTMSSTGKLAPPPAAEPLI